MPSLHFTLDVADMTQALKDSFDVDDIAKEMMDHVDAPDATDVARELDFGEIADCITDGHGFHEEVAKHVDLVALAKAVTPEIYSTALADMRKRIDHLEALLGKVAATLLETPAE